MLLFGTAAVALVTTSWSWIKAWIKVRRALLLEMTWAICLVNIKVGIHAGNCWSYPFHRIDHRHIPWEVFRWEYGCV